MQKLSDLTEEQKEKYYQLMEWVSDSNIQEISGIPPADRNFYLGVQGSNGNTLLHYAAQYGLPNIITALLNDFTPEQKVELLSIQTNVRGLTPLHVAVLRGSPERITAILEGLNAAQCKMLILGDVEKGIKGVVSKLVEGGGADKISVLIAGINGVSSLTQEDRYALMGGIAAHYPPGTKIPVDVGILRQAFGAARNAPGEQDPAATAAVVSPPAAEQDNGATPPGCGGYKHPVVRRKFGFDR